MTDETKTNPNWYAYSENRQDFKVTRSTLHVATKRIDNKLVGVRELHLSSVPESKKLREEFSSIAFRIVENTFDSPTDKGGNPIVGGVNSFPEPAHVVLFVSPDTLTLLNQRQKSDRYLISIYPGASMLEWKQEEAIPVYEMDIFVEG